MRTLRFLSVFLFLILPLFSFELQKPKTYENQIEDFSNWVASEKLDGIRAFWNTKELLTKNGNKIYAPAWFIKDLPDFELDGELWSKRSDFENIQNIVLDKNPSKNWEQISYNIFEVPNQKGNFFERLKIVEDYLIKNPTPHLKVVKQIKIKNQKQLDIYLQSVINKKGEGLILKNFTKNYFIGRSNDILKVKKFYDAEAKVIGINLNKNGAFKSLKVDFNGKIFNLGGGFNKKEKLNPPKIGDIITFKYYDFTKNGIPKFASFLRVRNKE